MRIPAASCTPLHALVTGPRQRLSWLGACASALYLVTEGDDVVAVLSHDAVRLPCALVLPWRAAERPLTNLLAHGDRPQAWIGEGSIMLGSGRCQVSIVATRQWRPPALRTGRPRPEAVGILASAVADRGSVAVLRIDVADLLGRGPGLTPTGDDVLAGYLVGARAFGVPHQSVADEVFQCAPTRTTALSAQLLRHAAAGECVPQLAQLVEACLGRADLDTALAALLAVGHTSGLALATGLVVAAQARLELSGVAA